MLTTAAGGAANVVDTPAATVMLVAWVALWPLASVTLTVKLKVPVAVGVPLRVPAGLRLMPAGRLPLLTDQVYGAGPAGFGQGVAVDGVGPAPRRRREAQRRPGMIVTVTGSVSLCPLLSVTLTVKE